MKQSARYCQSISRPPQKIGTSENELPIKPLAGTGKSGKEEFFSKRVKLHLSLYSFREHISSVFGLMPYASSPPTINTDKSE